MKSTFSRNFFPAAILLLVALLLVGTSFRALVDSYVTEQTVEDLESNSAIIADLASAYYTEGTLNRQEFLVNLSVAARVSGADTVIVDSSGRLLLCSDSPFGCPHQGAVLQNPEYLHKVLTEGHAYDIGVIQGLYNDQRYVVSSPILNRATGDAVGIIMLSVPTAATAAILSKVSQIYIFVSVLVVLVSVLIMSFFAKKQSRPLQDMAQAANDFGHGDLNARVQLKGDYSKETQELAIAFNNMASSLQKSEYQRQEFVANVSHELKTPMTTIGGYVDGILDGTIPPEKQRHYMQIVSDETKRLSRLVRSMLDISRLQDQKGVPDEKKTRFDLEECAGQVLITFEQKINSKNINVEVDMPEHPVVTFANQDYITQVIYNLLDNAVKFCPDGKTVGLKIREGNTKAYVSIFNDGDTIPPDELPLVFDRFHKLDKSRSQNRDGWGLGLYIVKTIVCCHGENISVSSLNGRTEFTFTMPLVG